jgi:signal transduction histidine kinase
MFQAARRRMVAWNVSVLTLILVVLGIAAYSAISSRIYAQVDQELRAQQDHEIGAIQHSADDVYAAVPANLYGYRTIVANGAGQVNMSSDCPYAAEGIMFPGTCPSGAYKPTSVAGIQAALTSGQDIRTVTFHDQPQRVFTFAVDVAGIPWIIQISRPVDSELATLSDIRHMLIFGGLLGVLLAALASVFLANRALIPIRQAFARQRKFTADASHELRTPLALIRANAEMLMRYSDRLPPEDGELIGEIIRETDHLNRLVGDLLTLARVDSDTLQLKTSKVDFKALVSDVLEDVDRIAESRGISSQLTLDGPVTVEGDETRLRQLLLILLDNSLKYTDPGGKVEVSLDRADGRARLVVADTGIGIPAADLPHIFERFYRVDRAREHESGGTGLGLAIARWIIQAHHGQVKVDSEVGRGTRFQIDLPAA